MQRKIMNVDIAHVLDIFLEKKWEKKVENQIRDINVKQQEGRSKAFYLMLSWTIWKFLCALVCFTFVEKNDDISMKIKICKL